MSSGGAGGSYQVYAERYRQALAKNRIELRERPSAGSIENLKRLLDEDDETEVALVQSGTANGINTDKLLSLGSLYYEPLWVFYRSDRELDRLTQFKGRRIAIGAEGSGTRKLSLDLLETNGLDAKIRSCRHSAVCRPWKRCGSARSMRFSSSAPTSRPRSGRCSTPKASVS
ncbi:MAG: hypothetical protein M5R42_06765 [Rhodocyclaceae bacterium]|nr:hypothetical protein [Rhodocyclaceae bacterium]